MKVSKTIITVLLAIALFVGGIILFDKLTNKAQEIEYSTLQQKINAGEVDRIYISGDYTCRVLYKNSSISSAERFPSKYDAYCYIANRASVLAITDGKNVAVIYNDPNQGSWIFSLLPILGLVAFGVLLFVMFRQSMGANNKAMGFGRTKARMLNASKVRFTDVAGAEEEKEELREIVEFLKSPKKFTDVGARIPKGVLLVGPPGTGKTLFAKAVAGEAGVPFFSISGSDFVEMFVGVGASRVRDLFDQAKNNMPCIVFIDEIDAVGRQRGTGLGGGHDEREQTLNQLLVQMDGFTNNDGIIVMAATNRADILDPALVRPGRFDRQIYVNAPDVRGREAILKVHSRNKPLGNDIDFKVLARMTSGFTGADIENLLNEAAIFAARDDRKVIVMHDILEGIDKVIAGPRKTSRLVTESDKRITAYHESGHAIVAKLLPHCDQVQEVSIIPRGAAAGYTLSRPETDDNHVTKNELLDDIAMMLGGRAAEEIVIKDISTGASNDIQRASEMARKMVTEWGMSEEVGTFFLGGSHEVFIGRDYQAQHTYSENMATKIDAEIKKILDTAYSTALKLLKENRSILDNMVKVLYEKETIYTAEVEALMGGATASEVLSDKRLDEIEEKPQKNSESETSVPLNKTEDAEVSDVKIEKEIKDTDDKTGDGKKSE